MGLPRKSNRNRPNKAANAVYWILFLSVAGLCFWIVKNSGPPVPPTAPAQKTAPVVMMIQKTNDARPVPEVLSVEKPTNGFLGKFTNEPASVLVKTAEVRQLPFVKTNLASAKIVPTNSFLRRPVQNIFEAQLALGKRGISSGSIDGLLGPQTRAALLAFQQQENLTPTGALDYETKARLVLTAAPYTNYMVTSNDLARLQPVGATWLAKSQQSRLDYETILELVAEKSCCHPNFVRKLNPFFEWTNLTAQTIVQIPNMEKPQARQRAAFVRIRLSERTLEAFDSSTNLLAHFPCSIAQRVEKRPIGELRVAVLAPDPNYVFDPENFPESPEARQMKRKLLIPPGPNNPVGTAWIGLDKPGYGIHGTPRPEEVGRTESHGCFRLANWNADYLIRLVGIGTPIYVEP